MQQRIVWVHGIGLHRAGYSNEWRTNFNPDLQLAPENYLEVVWDTVFHPEPGDARSLNDAGGVIDLTPQEQLAEQEVRAELEMILLARTSAMEEADATRALDDAPVEWSELYGAEARGVFDFLWNPDESLGDFAKYLVSRNVRNAVKERLKEQLRPLAGGDFRISIIAHSWGTVVSYDSLLDLHAEVPALRVANLITLGSPLWLVRRMLEDRSGRKPAQLAGWINIHARGDAVGSWLKPGFMVDREWRVPHFGGAGPHSSYFVAGNVAVQRDLVAPAVLGR